jgi:phage baseplate assembly protein W
MAIVLGQKNVKDTESFNDYAIGITLPIQISNTTKIQSYTTRQQIASNIKNLLLTRKGERILQPEFGSGLHEILFDFNNDDLPTKIEDTITDAINQWLPYVTIDSIDVEQTDYLKDRNQANVSIKFKVGDDVQLNEITFTV